MSRVELTITVLYRHCSFVALSSCFIDRRFYLDGVAPPTVFEHEPIYIPTQYAITCTKYVIENKSLLCHSDFELVLVKLTDFIPLQEQNALNDSLVESVL